jgi:diadenosine tetraphosphate (Ap4A) HIT family hydrolase
MLIPGCISCDILAGTLTVPGGVIYENEYWHVDSVMSPVCWRGFLLVKLKRHCEQLAELTQEEADTLGPVIQATCSVLADVLKPAKVYICSFGDGIKHIHFWVLPRHPNMRPGMHWVMMNLNARTMLTRLLGIRRWVCSDEEVTELAVQLRERIHRLLS